MTRRNSILGALFLGAVCLCAFGAATAFAASIQLHECKEATGGTGETAVRYSDSNCQTENESGKFSTQLVTGSKVPVTAYGTGAFGLLSVLSGVKVNIDCSTLTGEGTAENSGEIAKGEGVAVFSGCVVSEPAGKGCTVKEPIMTNIVKGDTKGMKVHFVPAAGETFVTFAIEGATCPAGIKGEKPVKGSATGEVTEGAPTAVEFTESSGSSLSFGGQTLKFIGNGMLRTPGGADISFENPVPETSDCLGH